MQEKFRTWLRERSALTQAAIMGLFWAVPFFAVEASLRGRGASWGLLAGSLIGGVIFGGFMAFTIRRQQRRNGGASMSRAMEEAIRSGSLPVGVDPASWLPLLRCKRKLERRMLWIGPLEFGLFTALGVYLVVTEPDVPFWWLATAIFVGLAVWTPIWTMRRRRRIEALIEELEERATP